MIILALDTTAVTATVALLDDENVLGVSSIHNKLTHSEKLLPMIDELLKNSGYTIDDVELIGVSKGPGSFTGVRIGIATVKGIAFATGASIVGVSSLECLAENFRYSHSEPFSQVIISASMDARRDELYNALFSYDGNEIKRITSDRAISCEELYEELKTTESKILINGDGAEKTFDFLKSHGKYNIALAPQIILRQNAVSVGRVAYRNYLCGLTDSVNEIAPLYLRTSQAERMNNKE